MAALGSQRAGPHPLGDEKKEASRRPGLHSKRTSVSPLAGEKVTSRTPVLEKGKVVGVRKASPWASPSSQAETPGPPCGLVDHRANTPDEGPAGGSVSTRGLEQTEATRPSKNTIFFCFINPPVLILITFIIWHLYLPHYHFHRQCTVYLTSLLPHLSNLLLLLVEPIYYFGAGSFVSAIPDCTALTLRIHWQYCR